MEELSLTVGLGEDVRSEEKKGDLMKYLGYDNGVCRAALAWPRSAK